MRILIYAHRGHVGRAHVRTEIMVRTRVWHRVHVSQGCDSSCSLLCVCVCSCALLRVGSRVCAFPCVLCVVDVLYLSSIAPRRTSSRSSPLSSSFPTELWPAAAPSGAYAPADSGAQKRFAFRLNHRTSGG